MINSRDAEPWTYGEEVEQISRNYIKFRYQILPYIYSLFHEAVRTGIPVQRSLAIDYSHNPKVFEGQYHNQYLFGPYFLVAPVESDKEFVKVYLPEGEWYYLYNGHRYRGNSEVILECPLRRLPVFVKAGAIVPMQPPSINTSQVHDTLILHIYTGGDSSFEYYEDNGSTFDYQSGAYSQRKIQLQSSEQRVHLFATAGTYVLPFSKIKIIFHGLEAHVLNITVNNLSFALSKDSSSYFAALEKFDPFYDPEPAPHEDVSIVEIPYTDEETVIKW